MFAPLETSFRMKGKTIFVRTEVLKNTVVSRVVCDGREVRQESAAYKDFASTAQMHAKMEASAVTGQGQDFSGSFTTMPAGGRSTI